MSIAQLGLATTNTAEPRQTERMLPHDLLAEQSALGGMMLSKDAVADVVETVRGGDFYVPKHEIIFDAIL
ncbi:DnaB-like helicase N-terminal domain-containing protein, partial [Cryobacterium sp. MLB-32]